MPPFTSSMRVPSTVSSCLVIVLLSVGLVSAGSCPSLPALKSVSGKIVTSTGDVLTINGADYIRLNGSQPAPVYHSTFSPTLANRTRDVAALEWMSSLSYNAARVFVDVGGWSRSDGVAGAVDSGVPLSSAYMANVAAFVCEAASRGIYTMITLPGLPVASYWLDQTQPNDPNIAPSNALYLHGPTVTAKADFVANFTADLQSRIGKAAMSSVLAMSLDNELSLNGNDLPFSSKTVTVTTANGKSYSMAVPAQRQAAADDNEVFALDLAAAAVRKQADVMVTVGMFTFQAVHKAGPNGFMYPSNIDPRYPSRPAILSQRSSLDYLDVHVYPVGSDFNVTTDLASSEWGDVPFDRIPVVGCEYGAFRQFFPTIQEAIAGMNSLRHALKCDNHFIGSMMWTWDTVEQPRLWYMTADGGLIAKALMQPPKCQ